MKTFFQLVFFCLFPFCLSAQISDSFSDHSLRDGPIWFGQLQHFALDATQLQLQNEQAASNNTSYLYTPLSLPLDTSLTWQFDIQLDFAPSASNFAKIILWSATPDHFAERQHIGLKIGGISGSEDAVELYTSEAGEENLLIQGTVGAVGTAPVQLSIKVVYAPSGKWTLWADYGQTGTFTNEGTAYFILPNTSGFFGLLCQYTSSRSDQFYFDNILIHPTQADTLPPQITSVFAIDDTTLQVHFSEPITNRALENIENIRLNGTAATIQTSSIDSLHPIQAELKLSDPLNSPEQYQLQFYELTDYAGNNTTAIQDFEFVKMEPARQGDLILTEIMADPIPSQGLPEVEYLEVYNASEKVLQLEGTQICINQVCRTLPMFALWPKKWLLLAAPSDTAALAPFGKVLAIPSLPSLVNNGAEIELYNPSNQLLQHLIYSTDWYSDTEKAKGGFSLELQQLDSPNNCSLNWKASENTLGGSPGIANSFSSTPSFNYLKSVIPLSSFELLLEFEHTLAEAPSNTLFSIMPFTGILAATLQYPETKAILLQLADTLKRGQVYELQVDTPLLDCLLRSLPYQQKVEFGLAEPPKDRDIVINEVLFNPLAGASDYVELYNRSDKIINLNGFRLSNPAKLSGDTTTFVQQDYLLFPQQFVVLTEDTASLKFLFPNCNTEQLLLTDLPTLADESGSFALLWQEQRIDRFDYEENMHHPLLDETEGVALERLHPDYATQSAANWHSAAATTQFGTPTFPNSQGLQRIATTDNYLYISPDAFSPNGDGYDDLLSIQYQNDTPGGLLHLSIYDLQGRLVQTLAQNTLLGTNALFHWDGTTQSNVLAGIGIYIVFSELLFPDGQVLQERTPVVLALPME